MGQIPGGCSRAQRYPQTVQRQTGSDSEGNGAVERGGTAFFLPRSDRGGRRSGTGVCVRFSASDRFVYIKCTVAGTKIIEIRIPVVAGADNIKVFFPFS